MDRTVGSERRGGFTARLATSVIAAALAFGACGSPPAATSSPANVASAAASSSPVRSSSPPTATPTPVPPLPLLGSLPTNDLDATKAKALQAILDDTVHSGAPDVIAAIITGDGAWAGAAGIAGAKGRKATADDEFAIASITKTFTAALVMRLVEQGKMDLDAPLASYLGDLKVDANGATVQQALEMRAGLPDFAQPAAADHIHVDAAHVWTAEEMVAEFDAPTSPAGETYLYSSPTYELLARAAENVTGMSYASALRRELLDPWHADRIIGQGPEHLTPKPWALPIDSHLGAWTPADLGVGGAIINISSATYAPGAGSVASDAPSLAAWVWHLFAADILTGESLRLMAPQGAGFAYGLESAPYGARSVGAAGGKTGYGAQFTYFPESGAVIVIFVNDPDFVVEPTVSALLEAATTS